jgi:hypothetical protein
MPAKVIWDYTYYWGILCQFFFQRRLTDLPALSRLRRELAAVQALNLEVQEVLRSWSQAERPVNPPRMLDQAALPWFAELNRSLGDPLDDAAFDARMRRNAQLLQDLAAEIFARARAAGVDVVMETPAPAQPPAPLLFKPAA